MSQSQLAPVDALLTQLAGRDAAELEALRSIAGDDGVLPLACSSAASEDRTLDLQELRPLNEAEMQALLASVVGATSVAGDVSVADRPQSTASRLKTALPRRVSAVASWLAVAAALVLAVGAGSTLLAPPLFTAAPDEQVPEYTLIPPAPDATLRSSGVSGDSPTPRIFSVGRTLTFVLRTQSRTAGVYRAWLFAANAPESPLRISQSIADGGSLTVSLETGPSAYTPKHTSEDLIVLVGLEAWGMPSAKQVSSAAHGEFRRFLVPIMWSSVSPL